jgi:hypothetical protein
MCDKLEILAHKARALMREEEGEGDASGQSEREKIDWMRHVEPPWIAGTVHNG